MKTKLTTLLITTLAAISASAVTTQISVQGSNIVLRWPSQPSQSFVIGYRAALDVGNPWTLFATNPASGSNETVFIVTNVVPLQNFGGGGGGGGSGGPPGPGSAALLSGDAADTWMPFEIPDFIYPPGLQKEPEKWAQLAAARGATLATADSGGGNLTESFSVSGGFFIVSELYEDADGDGLPTSFDLALNYNPFITDTDGDGTDDGRENIDGDSFDNATEVLIGTDPLVADDEVWTPPASGGVHDGDFVLPLATPMTLSNDSTGIIFDASGYTADNLVTTQPSSTTMRLQWNVTYIDRGFFAGAADAGELPSLTPEERVLLRDAFDEGTSFWKTAPLKL